MAEVFQTTTIHMAIPRQIPEKGDVSDTNIANLFPILKVSIDNVKTTLLQLSVPVPFDFYFLKQSRKNSVSTMK